MICIELSVSFGKKIVVELTKVEGFLHACNRYVRYTPHIRLVPCSYPLTMPLPHQKSTVLSLCEEFHVVNHNL